MTDEERRKMLQERIDIVSKSAEKIYDLMSPGMVIEVRLFDSPIISPTGPQKRRSLYLIRPAMFVQIKQE